MPFLFAYAIYRFSHDVAHFSNVEIITAIFLVSEVFRFCTLQRETPGNHSDSLGKHVLPEN